MLNIIHRKIPLFCALNVGKAGRMSRGLSLFKKRLSIFLCGFQALAVMLGSVGCVPPSIMTQAPVVAALEACTPVPLETVNVYRTIPQPWANIIFEYAYSTTPVTSIPAFTQFQGAQYAAFQKLITETQRWSDTETITLDGANKVRITLTFVSPQLLQAVYLNQVLKDGYPTSGFPEQLQNMLNNVAARDELLFLLTVSPANSINPIRHTIELPIDEIILNNSENLQVPHSHDDHNLAQSIDTASDAVFGYLAFPFTQSTNGECKWVLNPKFNTNIVVTMPYIKIDGTKNNTPYSWTIPYTSLINQVITLEALNFNPPPGYNLSIITPSSLPPSGLNQPNYEQDFAKFIWQQITGSY